MMGWPRIRPSGSESARATVSAAPPGAKPTTRRTGLLGYWPAAFVAASTSAAAITSVLIAVLLEPSIHDQHDLAHVPVRFHVRLRGRQLGEREGAVHQRLDASVGDGGQQARHEPRHARGALLGAAQLVGNAEER